MIGDNYAVARGLPAQRRSAVARVVEPLAAGPQRSLAALSRSDLVQLMLAMSLFAGAILLYLMQAENASVTQLNISMLQSQQAQLNAQLARSQTQASNLGTEPRVQYLATSELHMSAPGPANTVWLNVTLPPIQRVPPPVNVNRSALDSEPLAQIKSFIR